MSSVNVKYVCSKCGGHELSFHKYVKCITPVSLQENGHIEYGQSIINEDDYLATLNGFACQSCGELIEHCGIRMENEKQLIDYLAMDTDVRQQQQKDYEEILDAQIYAQELKEKQQRLYSKEITD